MVDCIKCFLKGQPIDDLYVTGFVDIEDGVAQFYNDLRYIYIEINSKYIQFENIDQFSKIKMKIVDSIEYTFEVDEDMIKAKSSISEIVLLDKLLEGNEIETITFYNLVERETEIISDAIKIKLVNGQIIFLDPTFYYGTGIGGVEQKEMWELNITKNHIINECCIQIK